MSRADDLTGAPTLTTILAPAPSSALPRTCLQSKPGENPVDRRADIWAFGVVLCSEMLSGRRLYPLLSTTETLAAVIRDGPKWKELPSNTPPGDLQAARPVFGKGRQATPAGHWRSTH